MNKKIVLSENTSRTYDKAISEKLGTLLFNVDELFTDPYRGQ